MQGRELPRPGGVEPRMSRANQLTVLRLSEPCPVPWDSMRGNDRVRFCEHCKLHVHNLSNMTDDEAEAFLSKRPIGARTCAQMTLRDGELVTLDYGTKPSSARKWAALVAIGAATVAGAGGAVQLATAQNANLRGDVAVAGMIAPMRGMGASECTLTAHTPLPTSDEIKTLCPPQTVPAGLYNLPKGVVVLAVRSGVFPVGHPGGFGTAVFLGTPGDATKPDGLHDVRHVLFGMPKGYTPAPPSKDQLLVTPVGATADVQWLLWSKNPDEADAMLRHLAADERIGQ
jgi:hypothetical protein